MKIERMFLLCKILCLFILNVQYMCAHSNAAQAAESANIVSQAGASDASSYQPHHIILDFVQAGIEGGQKNFVMPILEHYVDAYVPEALYVKGVLYLNGCYNDGVRNPREGTIYFAKAAALGYVPAMSALADSYLNGDGAIENTTEAVRLYTQAAKKGDGIAQFNLAVLYRDGIGVKSSIEKAMHYFKCAAHNPELSALNDEAQKLHDELVAERKHRK
jgi:TPR repeat protein